MQTFSFLPEGYGSEQERRPLPLAQVREQMAGGEILEGTVVRCDGARNLHVAYRGYRGLIPREEAILPSISGAGREIALLARVGRPVRFQITSIAVNGGGQPLLMLSRRRAQERALQWLLESCPPGTVVRGKVTHLERFGAFVDIGCGVVALLPLDRLSVSRVDHPRRRLRTGQDILALVTNVDRERQRFTLSLRELLGTWLENAGRFQAGETVTGTVRGIQPYGAFVELTPNLSGLAELREELEENERVSVFLKSIRPEAMKIKFQIIQRLGPETEPQPLPYRITDGFLERWRYAPEGAVKAAARWDAPAPTSGPT